MIEREFDYILSARSQASSTEGDSRSLNCLLGSNIDDTAAKSLFYNMQRTIIKRDDNNNNVMTYHHRHHQTRQDKQQQEQKILLLSQ